MLDFILTLKDFLIDQFPHLLLVLGLEGVEPPVENCAAGLFGGVVMALEIGVL